MAWDNLTTTYVIRQARIVAMVKDRGAIVEVGDFEFEEGRFAVEYGSEDADRYPPLLEYTAAFRTLGAGVPDAGEAMEARIVIDGTCDDGPVEIRGDGWFGYDDKGNVEGRFEPLPPTIFLDFIPQDEAPQPDDGMSTDERVRWMMSISPKTSAQYERAGRDLRSNEDD